MPDRPARAIDLDTIPIDTTMLDDLSEEAIADWFMQAEAGSSTRYLWQCAFVDWFRRHHGGTIANWSKIPAERLGKGPAVIRRYAKLWDLYDHFRKGGVRSEIEAFASLSAGMLNELGKVPEDSRVEAARFLLNYVAEHGEPTCRSAARLMDENGFFPRRPPERRESGDVLGFRGLVYAPVNEHGVILLFGMVARDLDFVVESVQAGYPDCAAKRVNRATGRYAPVRIEFEFRSSGFLAHRHDPSRCDLIVCWEHDWFDCPLDVVELRSEIQKLGRTGQPKLHRSGSA